MPHSRLRTARTWTDASCRCPACGAERPAGVVVCLERARRFALDVRLAQASPSLPNLRRHVRRSRSRVSTARTDAGLLEGASRDLQSTRIPRAHVQSRTTGQQIEICVERRSEAVVQSETFRRPRCPCATLRPIPPRDALDRVNARLNPRCPPGETGFAHLLRSTLHSSCRRTSRTSRSTNIGASAFGRAG